MTNRILKLLKDRAVKTLAILCGQWGDTGKGKYSALFAAIWAHIIVRGTSGDNAGHTIWRDGIKYVVHLLPSGILEDKEGKTNVIGNGTAFNPLSCRKELGMIQEAGFPVNNLRISHRANLLLPQHLVMDRIKEASTKEEIGTTKKGIGPCYTDRTARIGLTINDMYNKDVFVRKLKRNLEDKVVILREYDRDDIKRVMMDADLENGMFYNERTIFDIDAIVERYTQHAAALSDFVTDTDALVQAALGKENILLEGAQGNMLSVDHGTYPYVTSTDCTLAGLAKRAGLREDDVGLTIAIFKAYTTRVGGGPFATEMGGERSERWCGTKGVNRLREIAEYGDSSVNSEDEFLQGVALRGFSDEYGATTGRPRRCGWYCKPTARYSLPFCGRRVLVCVTRLDSLSSFKRLKVCKELIYRGPRYRLGNLVLQAGHVFQSASPDPEVLRHCVPVYEELPGWDCEIDRTDNHLPPNLLNYVRYLEQGSGAEVGLLSLGKEPEATYVL